MEHEYWREEIAKASDELLVEMALICIQAIEKYTSDCITEIGIPVSNLVNEFKKRGLSLTPDMVRVFVPILQNAVKEVETNRQRLQAALETATKDLN